MHAGRAALTRRLSLPKSPVIFCRLAMRSAWVKLRDSNTDPI